MKFEKPSRIQAKTLPMILQPPYRSLIAQVRLCQLIAAMVIHYCYLTAPEHPLNDNMAEYGTQAHNGSGKTTCFTLAMLSRVDPRLNQPQALCLCPTRYSSPPGLRSCALQSLGCAVTDAGRTCRELVSQNVMVLEKMGKFTSIKATSTIAVASFPRQAGPLLDHIDALVLTRGCLPVRNLLQIEDSSLMRSMRMCMHEQESSHHRAGHGGHARAPEEPLLQAHPEVPSCAHRCL